MPALLAIVSPPLPRRACTLQVFSEDTQNQLSVRWKRSLVPPFTRWGPRVLPTEATYFSPPAPRPSALLPAPQNPQGWTWIGIVSMKTWPLWPH